MEPKFKSFSDNFEYVLNQIIVEYKIIPEDIENEKYLEDLASFIQVILDPLEYKKETTIPNLKKSIINSFKERHFNYNIVNDEYDLLEYRQIFDFLSSIPAAEQRSLEWYQFRWDKITASDIARVCGMSGEIARFQAMFDKASKLEDYIQNRVKNNLTGDAIEHGKKMEAVSVMIYEERNNVIIEEFGCLPHPFIPYLGASPDGIVSPKSPNLNYHGRMLEIKNPYTRPITGIPKTEYYAQVQGQLEVCGLEYCDFLETWIMEYKNEMEFKNDSPKSDPNSLCFRSNGLEKGIIFTYIDAENEDKPVHLYCPRNIKRESDFQNWYKNCWQKFKKSEYNILVGLNYWKLIQYNVITIKRDYDYFNSIKDKLKNFWDAVITYREKGTHLITDLMEQVRYNQRNNYFDIEHVDIEEDHHNSYDNIDFLPEDDDDDEHYKNHNNHNNHNVKNIIIHKKNNIDFLSDDD